MERQVCPVRRRQRVPGSGQGGGRHGDDEGRRVRYRQDQLVCRGERTDSGAHHQPQGLWAGQHCCHVRMLRVEGTRLVCDVTFGQFQSVDCSIANFLPCPNTSLVTFGQFQSVYYSIISNFLPAPTPHCHVWAVSVGLLQHYFKLPPLLQQRTVTFGQFQSVYYRLISNFLPSPNTSLSRLGSFSRFTIALFQTSSPAPTPHCHVWAVSVGLL